LIRSLKVTSKSEDNCSSAGYQTPWLTRLSSRRSPEDR
jgi:hypothetical protein